MIQFALNFRKTYIKYVRGGSGKGKYPHKKISPGASPVRPQHRWRPWPARQRTPGPSCCWSKTSGRGSLTGSAEGHTSPAACPCEHQPGRNVKTEKSDWFKCSGISRDRPPLLSIPLYFSAVPFTFHDNPLLSIPLFSSQHSPSRSMIIPFFPYHSFLLSIPLHVPW